MSFVSFWLVAYRRQSKAFEAEKAKVVHSHKLAIIGQMATEIAHEIRTPLNVISTSNELLRNAFLSGDLDQKNKHSNKIDSMIDRISKIINSLRHMTHNSHDEPFILCSINNIITDAVSLCEFSIRKKDIKFKVSMANPDVEVECRASEISQILMNLIQNAIDAVENSTHPWIELKCIFHSNEIEISVTDNGSGVKKGDGLKLFDPFFTTKEIGKGTGLGLYISRTLAENHMGELYLDERHSSTRFVLKIPYVQVENRNLYRKFGSR